METPEQTNKTGAADPPKDETTDATAQHISVPPEPPLSAKEKTWAGILMILAMLFAFGVLIVNWPNKPPTADNTTYRYKWFHVTLIEPPKQAVGQTPEQKKAADNLVKDQANATAAAAELAVAQKAVAADKAAGKAADNTAVDKASAAKTAADNAVADDNKVIKSLNEKAEADAKSAGATVVFPTCGTIQYATLILILVAAAGFLGNLVYVASSFTAFVGAEKFKRSWTMWYVVKPFTASGLAVFLYLGLNGTTISAPVNLNGILAAAALAGLFTDIATQKLKEIFTAAFKPTDNRPDKMTDGKVTVDLANIHPESIDVNQVNNFFIPGQNLDPKNIIVSINGTKILPPAITITPTLIKFPYTVTDKTLTKFTLLITDAKNVKIDSKDLGVAVSGKTMTVDLSAMKPAKIDVNAPNPFEIPGQNLDPKNIIVSINGTKIDPATITITPVLIKFPYTADNKTLTKFTLLITDAKGAEIDGKDLGVV